jgi:hypothetical protein
MTKLLRKNMKLSAKMVLIFAVPILLGSSLTQFAYAESDAKAGCDVCAKETPILRPPPPPERRPCPTCALP